MNKMIDRDQDFCHLNFTSIPCMSEGQESKACMLQITQKDNNCYTDSFIHLFNTYIMGPD